jgi:hypothetical protein
LDAGDLGRRVVDADDDFYKPFVVEPDGNGFFRRVNVPEHPTFGGVERSRRDDARNVGTRRPPTVPPRTRFVFRARGTQDVGERNAQRALERKKCIEPFDLDGQV